MLADVCQRGHTDEGLKEKQAAPSSVSGIFLPYFVLTVLKDSVFSFCSLLVSKILNSEKSHSIYLPQKCSVK